MEEIKIEAMDMTIHSIMKSIYSSSLEDQECELVIENAIEELSSMMSYDYKDMFLERFEEAKQEMHEHIEKGMFVDQIMEELGWGSSDS